MKPLLTADQLIAHLEEKGVLFNIDSKERAKDFLENHNYFMKLSSYRENYKKHKLPPNEGKYIDLEFAYLRELSTIDRHLRYHIIQMTLDIEHYLKVRLLNAIENNPKEDGYKIVQKFLTKDEHFYYLKEIRKHKSSAYCKSLIDTYYPYFPAWVFVELVSFGTLSYFCEFYREVYKYKIVDRILLNAVRDIRNAAAHSNCLINHLPRGNNKPHQSVKDQVKQITTIGENMRGNKLKNKVLYDFTCLLFLYDDLVPKSAKVRQLKILKDFFTDRMILNKDWFKNNTVILSSYDYALKVLEYFVEKNT